ncbi:MAG: FAD-dependent oxidoreductase [Pseudomonadota bacterium]
MNAKTSRPVDCVIAGAGPAGLTAALCLAEHGVTVHIVGPRPPAASHSDGRTAAVFQDGIGLFQHLDAWPHMATHAAPLSAIRMVDMSQRLLRAPQVLFEAQETGVEAFGYNIPNTAIVAGLALAAEQCAQIVWHDTTILGCDVAEHAVTMTCADGQQIVARVVIAADGRRSLVRDAAGLPVRTWDYDQVALTSQFAHAAPHNDVSTELHFEAGPCTSVPLPGNRSSLVWMERPHVALRLLAHDACDFDRVLALRFADFLGPLTDISAPHAVTLRGLIAHRFGDRRVLLVGEAAHAFPPIGAQGLNLGLRDAAEAAGCVLDALERNSDPGHANVTRTYHRRRWADITGRSTVVNSLNQSLTGDNPLLPLVRGAGLHIVKASSALRRNLIRQGMTGLGRRPRLMPEGMKSVEHGARLAPNLTFA